MHTPSQIEKAPSHSLAPSRSAGPQRRSGSPIQICAGGDRRSVRRCLVRAHGKVDSLASWLKLGYFTDAVEAEGDYWLRRQWVSDGPGRSSPRWRKRPKPSRGRKYPPFGPAYEVGDRLVIYVTGLGRCPAILEVTAEPEWDPGRVDAEARQGDGNQWGVITKVKGVQSVALDQAPALESIGVAARSIRRKGHIGIKEWQYVEAERLIAGAQRRRPGGGTSSTDVPIEEGEVEGYDVRPAAAVKRAHRRELKLVHDYCGYIEQRGDEVSRKKLLPQGASHPLYSDIFNKSRLQLIEAKASTERNDIRMAIGQLADYARLIPGAPRRAVLLEAKPHPDLLELLDSQGIGAIWRAGSAFTDNARGEFT